MQATARARLFARVAAARHRRGCERARARNDEKTAAKFGQLAAIERACSSFGACLLGRRSLARACGWATSSSGGGGGGGGGGDDGGDGDGEG